MIHLKAKIGRDHDYGTFLITTEEDYRRLFGDERWKTEKYWHDRAIQEGLPPEQYKIFLDDLFALSKLPLDTENLMDLWIDIKGKDN